MANQQELFNEWKYVCHKLELLRGYIQNDFALIKKDGYVTNEQIRKSINEFEMLYNKNIAELDELKNQIIELMQEVSNVE